MMNLRQLLGVFGLALCLVLVGCGQAASNDASLEVTSIPQAEVFVDGVSQGQSGATYQLNAGQHTVEVRLSNFETYTTQVTLSAEAANKIDAVLMPQDPSDPVVIAKLAESLDVEVAPFVAPRTTRGGSSRSSAATLLWPARDVRKDGLVNYAVEADETYGGDAALEFRYKTKVLYRESFNPESVTTVRSIPAEVLEYVKIGRTITWGLYFNDRRRAITTKFKIVQRPKADRQLEKLRNSRHMQRQPLITRQIMAATILENNRLYTESLVTNLNIAAEHPSSLQPYRGIVTTLRRLDGQHSELFAFVSPFVSGRGGRAGVARPTTGPRNGPGLSIATWSPIQQGAAPTAGETAPASAGSPASQGVTPADQGTAAPDSTDSATADAGTTDSATSQASAKSADATALIRERSTQADEASREASEVAAGLRAAAEEANAAANAADGAAAEAEGAALAARQTVEQAEEPTRAQQEAMAAAGMAAEEAREAANVAREGADAANEDAARMADAATAAASEAAALKTAVEQSSGNQANPLQAGPADGGTPEADAAAAESAALAATQAVTDSEAGVVGANAAVVTAEAALEAAEVARESGADGTAEAYEQAVADLASANDSAGKAQQQLEDAREAVQSLGQQVEAAPSSNLPTTGK